jgi:heme/copper-type cytochrome/quinol oxidase subunit 1
MTTTYRTCPRSGLQFEKQAEKLMKANAFVAVVWLLIGGMLAIGVALTRWPAVHWLEADTFYMVLTAHGIDMLIFWIIFFEIAILYFCQLDPAALSIRDTQDRLAGLRADAHRLGDQQHRGLPGAPA